MSEHIKLSNEEIEISNILYKTRIDYLVKLGEVKLAEINNEKVTEETYFNITELNTRESQFIAALNEKYGKGNVDLTNGIFIKKT
jgi:hypothetical protein